MEILLRQRVEFFGLVVLIIPIHLLVDGTENNNFIFSPIVNVLSFLVYSCLAGSIIALRRWGTNIRKHTSLLVAAPRVAPKERSVDPRRFELLTSSLQTRRTTSCAMGPRLLQVTRTPRSFSAVGSIKNQLLNRTGKQVLSRIAFGDVGPKLLTIGIRVGCIGFSLSFLSWTVLVSC